MSACVSNKQIKKEKLKTINERYKKLKSLNELSLIESNQLKSELCEKNIELEESNKNIEILKGNLEELERIQTENEKEIDFIINDLQTENKELRCNICDYKKEISELKKKLNDIKSIID